MARVRASSPAPCGAQFIFEGPVRARPAGCSSGRRVPWVHLPWVSWQSLPYTFRECNKISQQSRSLLNTATRVCVCCCRLDMQLLRASVAVLAASAVAASSDAKLCSFGETFVAVVPEGKQRPSQCPTRFSSSHVEISPGLQAVCGSLLSPSIATRRVICVSEQKRELSAQDLAMVAKWLATYSNVPATNEAVASSPKPSKRDSPPKRPTLMDPTVDCAAVSLPTDLQVCPHSRSLRDGDGRAVRMQMAMAGVPWQQAPCVCQAAFGQAASAVSLPLSASWLSAARSLIPACLDIDAAAHDAVPMPPTPPMPLLPQAPQMPPMPPMNPGSNLVDVASYRQLMAGAWTWHSQQQCMAMRGPQPSLLVPHMAPCGEVLPVLCVVPV